MSLRVGASFGPYDVLPLEGRGGMAEVYRAHDTRLNRDVVLKVLRPHRNLDARAAFRLKREAHLLASLNHPNIAAIYGVEQHAGIQALVLELVEGPTLADRIAQGPLPIEQALGIARQIAAALDAAHGHGIVHRDVKPSNVKLRPDGTVKVLDFGLATLVNPGADPADQSASTLTAPVDALVGTTPYMSPEQAQGHPLDRRTDIWSFGCVLYEMLTGRRAFEGANAAQTIAAIVGLEPRWEYLPADVPTSCRAVIERCLQKSAANRIRDIGDVRLALDGAFAPGPSANAAALATGRRSHARQLMPWFMAATAVGAVVAGLGRTPRASSEPLTFELHAPDGTTFIQATMEPYPALSPDGRRLAFSAQAQKESVRSIWIQTIGELEATSLAGTERGSAPFWSPDGQSLGFLADAQVKRVSLSGDRLVQIVSRGPAQYGATWMPGDVIVFSGLDGIYRVAADGGEAARVTRLDELSGEYSHRWPMAVPGSRSLFAYLARSSHEQGRGIHLASLDEPSLKERLVPDDSNPAFGVDSDGRLRLFFVHEATLLAQTLDAAARQLTGEPIVVARPVTPGETGRFAPFAVAGRTVVHRPANPSLSRMVWTNRRGERQATLSDASTEHRFPALSPDGTVLAVAEMDAQTGRLDIWVIDLLRHTRERLTRDPVGALFPVWMPDSRTIVYASGQSGVFDLYSRSARATTDSTLLFDARSPVIKYPSDITRDGRHVVVQSADQQMFLLSLDGTGTISPLPSGLQGRVSPDGRWLAYTSAENATRQVYVTTFPEATERWRVSTTSGEDPQWRSDGRELFYIEAGHTLTAVPVLPGHVFATGPARPLFRASFPARGMAFGPSYAAAADGQRFVVLEADRDKEDLLRVTTNWRPDAGVTR